MDTANNDVSVIVDVEIMPDSTPVKGTPQKFRTLDKDAETDYNYARQNLKSVIERGSSALDEMLALASQLDHPRAYEVISQLIKSVSDSNKQLIELQKDMREIADESSNKKTGKGATNIAFIGSPHDLQKLIKGKTKIEDIPILDEVE